MPTTKQPITQSPDASHLVSNILASPPDSTRAASNQSNISRDLFEISHQMLRHEDTQINNRLNWLIAVHALLFAAVGTILAINFSGKTVSTAVWLLGVPIIFLAITISIAIHNMVSEAGDRKRVIDDYWRNQRGPKDPETLRDNTPNPPWWRVTSIPLYFIAAWLVVTAVWTILATR